MDMIALEMDSMTSKTPDNMYYTLCFMKKHKNIQNVWRHLAAILEFCL